jgi:hypothetical protein
MIEVSEMKRSDDIRARNLHQRLTAAESAIRILQKERSR